MSEQPFSAADVPAGGAMVRCARCDTRWLARPFENLVPLSTPGTDVSDAVVIEDTAPQSRQKPPPPITKLPPGWRRTPVDRRLKALGIVFGVLAAVVVLRAPIVSALPEMQRLPVDVGLLEFQNVRSETVHVGGVGTLFIEGEIVNRAAGHVELPAIRITLLSPAGEPVTSWLVELAADSLAAGRSIGFRSALAAPPGAATQVTLNLDHRRAGVALH